MFGYGAGDFLGYSIAFFAFAALLCRPYSGKWVDVVGRKYVMIIGITVCIFLGFFYMLSATLLSFLILRFLHGFSAGFAPTGFTSYLSDIIPSHRRGEAMGILGMITSSAFGVGPVSGAFTLVHFGEVGIYVQSILFALVALILALSLPALNFKKKPFTRDLLKLNISDLFELRVSKPFHIMWMTIFSFGSILILVQDHAVHLGFPSELKAMFFMCYVGSSIVVRFFAGKISDKVGREPVLLAGVCVNIIAMLMLAFAKDQYTFIFAGLIFGVSAGVSSPTLFAWANDLAENGKVGRAFSTLFIAIEIGIISGSLLAGTIYQGLAENLSYAYILCALLSFLAAVLLLSYILKNPRFRKVRSDQTLDDHMLKG